MKLIFMKSNQRKTDEVQKKKKEKTQKTKKRGDNWKIYQNSYISELSFQHKPRNETSYLYKLLKHCGLDHATLV